MGTRSLTHVKSATGKTLLTIYRQYDGYPSGMGADIAEFIKAGTLVNGLGLDDDKLYFNGMECFAAALVAALKEGPGNIYIYPLNSRDCWEEYTYEVKPIAGSISIRYSTAYDPKVAGRVTAWTPWMTPQELIDSAKDD
jgi:hypothetical protein